MHLTFHSTYLSIKDFPDIELPRFTLITGANGTGKSHVLKAIKQGHLRNSITTNLKDEIRLYDWTNFFPNDQGAFDGRSWMQQRLSTFDNFQNISREFGGELLDAARAAGLPGEYLIDAAHVASLNLQELTDILVSPEKAETAQKIIQEKAENVGTRIRQRIQQNEQQRKALDSVIKYTSKPIVSLSSKDFYADNEERWGQVDMFQQSLGQVFVAYRDLALKNELGLLARERGQPSDALSADDFSAKHMIAPWIFVNDAIKTAHLDFEVDHPDLYDYVPYRPKLKKTSTGAEIFFGDLSSGEKVLMSLALCLYYTEDKRQLATYPKILLLDEIDAPLHPSMSRLYLEVLTDTVVRKHNICVVATTHSPSTVALAPEDSLYVLEPGKFGLQKTTKSRALNILTDGVPTLAISFDGRRQVFVESPNDAQLYDAVNQNLKAYIRSERSLEFIATGIKHPTTDSHLNTGCETVRHLVETLS